MSFGSSCRLAGASAAFAAALIFLNPIAKAATLHVCPSGCPFPTIQSAIDGAASGDVIQIAAGRFIENLLIVGKRLTLSGVPGDNVATEVHAAGRGPTIVLGSGLDGAYEEVDIQNLTVSGGGHESGTGIGGGIQVRRGAFLHLSDSVLTHNVAQLGGGIGVNTPYGPVTTIVHCLIADNLAVSQVDVSHGVVFGNGGGVFVATGSTVAVRQSTVARNHAIDGGGFFTDPGAALSIDQSTVSENLAAQRHGHLGFSGGAGGGLAINSALTLSHSVVADNSTLGPESPNGGGLFIMLNGAKTTLTRSILARNSADPGNGGNGGGIFAVATHSSDVLALNGVYVVENQAAQDLAGGLAMANAFTLQLTNTTIRDNSGLNCSGAGCPP